MNIGVPQGSILGSLLFLVYINDMCNLSPHLAYLLFADDTTVMMKGSSLPDLVVSINAELQTFDQWARVNRLSVNAGKTKAMIFSNRCVPANLMDIVIDGVVVEVVNSLRFLGVHVDDRLCFSAHTASICSKISKSIGIFHKLKDYVPLDCLRNLYFSFIFPFVIYCNLIWGGTFKRYIDPIHLLQKKVIRIMNNAEYLAHTNCLFYKSEILNVFDIHNSFSAILFTVVSLMVIFQSLCNLSTLVLEAYRYPVTED